MVRTMLPLLLAFIAAPAMAQNTFDLSAGAKPAAPISGPGLSAPARGGAPNPYLHDETRAAAEANAVAMFERMDLDHDGFLTQQEITTFFAARVPKDKAARAGAMAKAMFDDADTDHDGKISAEEAKAAALRGFDEADTNHDGVVTPAERAAIVQSATETKAAPVKGKSDEDGR